MALPTVVLHRTQERRHLVDSIRIERLEEDADVSDARDAELTAKIDKLTNRMTGMIVSAAGATAAFAVNLIVLLRRG